MQGKSESMSESMIRRAYGKINLGLDVVRRRADGYHEVRMIMQTVSIYDRVELVKTERAGIELKSNLDWLPVDEGNIAYRAADMIRKEFHIRQGIRLRLEKHIPAAAGMAGGSADAAAVLQGMNELFSLGLSEQELRARGVKLGADVPYCIMGGTALAEGIGERLTRLPALPACPLLIATPQVRVSTKLVYEKLRADELRQHPDIDGMAEAIRRGELSGVISRLGNVLETVTASEYPIIEEIKALMRECGACGALMSGSGPTVFGIFENRETARRAAEAIKRKGLAEQVYEAAPVDLQEALEQEE